MSVCTEPFKDPYNDEFKNVIFEESQSDVLTDIIVEYENVEKIISKLSSKSGPGLDRVTLHCFKYGGSLIVEAITDIARDSLLQGYIPMILNPF